MKEGTTTLPDVGNELEVLDVDMFDACVSSLEWTLGELFVEFNVPFAWNAAKICGGDWPKACENAQKSVSLEMETLVATVEEI